MCSAGKVETETESREGSVDLVAPVRPLYYVEPTQSGEAVLLEDVRIVSSSNAIEGWDLSMSKELLLWWWRISRHAASCAASGSVLGLFQGVSKGEIKVAD